MGRRREARKEHKFPARTHGMSRGDTQLYWTRPDQLETRAWLHQIPTISSRCRLLYCTAVSLRNEQRRGSESIFMLFSEAEHHGA